MYNKISFHCDRTRSAYWFMYRTCAQRKDFWAVHRELVQLRGNSRRWLTIVVRTSNLYSPPSPRHLEDRRLVYLISLTEFQYREGESRKDSSSHFIITGNVIQCRVCYTLSLQAAKVMQRWKKSQKFLNFGC